tara:strand:- start:464 stop:955 length:492 start_codon:yes stop_codon:yes gene_type:complete
MKKLLLLAALCFPTAAYCDIQSSITSSVKLESLSAASTADKLGSSYSISGTNITTVDSNSNSTVGGFGSVTSGVPAVTMPTASITNAGETFSFSQAYLEGDATPTAAITSLGTVQNFSDLTSTAAGSVGTAAVTLDHHTMTLTGGTGTGIVLTGQFVTDLTID